jgi:hypothetical protein
VIHQSNDRKRGYPVTSGIASFTANFRSMMLRDGKEEDACAEMVAQASS